MTLAGPDQAAGTVALVAQPTTPPAEPGGQGEDFGKSSPVGLLVLLLFFVAVAFLVRSMTKHLKRVPPSFDPPEAGERPEKEPDERAEAAPPSNGEQDSADGPKT
ncbi:hypothetical protein [Actinophytocola sp.]|uniref:hypothetical protein n=1 Tax=Actinophytocola sp. TaxID=1872138 RepID=UPI003D6C2AEE